MPDFPAVSVEALADALPSFGRTLILTHVNPDADCVGSALGLGEMLRVMGKETKIVCPTPLPAYAAFLPSLAGRAPEELTPDPEDADRFDTVVSVDVASPAQLGDLAAYIPRIRFMVDHHGKGVPFAPCLIDPNAAAVGEILVSLYRILRGRGILPELPDAARCLYCAVVGDTGGFQFSNTTPATHRAAAELLDVIVRDADAGKPDPAELCRRLLTERTLTDLKARALAVKNLKLCRGGRLAAVLFTTDMLRKEGLTEEDLGGAVDIPRSVSGSAVALTLRQNPADPRKFRLSSRANTDVDCASVCASFGGGGHRRAAGCTIEADTPEEAFRIAVEAFSAIV